MTSYVRIEMRASRLLQILLLLQNRGRMTAPALAAELEVVPRTILRDVDAMTEAGLPVIVHRGARGGIELGFNYRSRLTGLADDEAEALAVWLAAPPPALAALGLSQAAARARAKLIESFPDRSRSVMARAARRFPRLEPDSSPDPRLAAVAAAIREGLTLTLRTRSPAPQVLHPVMLTCGPAGWSVMGPPLTAPVPLADWGDINLSRRPLATGPAQG
jgi:predicted DNA-binding transcriptional regulator YafY